MIPTCLRDSINLLFVHYDSCLIKLYKLTIIAITEYPDIRALLQQVWKLPAGWECYDQ